MPEWIQSFLEPPETPARWLEIMALFVVAYVIYRLRGPLSSALVRAMRITGRGRKMRPERLTTLRSIVANAITLVAFGSAILISLTWLIGLTNVIWLVGLFSAAFGIGANQHIRDLLTGLSFIFEDTLAVGEKVEVSGIEGVIESINLRTTILRAPSGEIWVVPNGEMRVVRNFSRGRFSMVEVTLKLQSTDLARALPILEALGSEAVSLLPNLLEPWRVISEKGVIGQQTELKLIAKARYGKAADMRPRLLALVHERLSEADIQLGA